MSLFYNLVIVSFLLAVSLAVFSNFLYKKWIICLEEIKEIKRFIQNLKDQILEYRSLKEKIQESQESLEDSLQKLESDFQALKETTTEIKSVQQTKKAMLDLMKGQIY